MEGTLKDYYITSGMIAEQWNESGYLTAEGTKWNADKVTKKFRMILNTIDGIIDSSGALENLYRSENGGKEGSHFIFFDAGEIMEHRQKFEVALLSEYGELIEEAPVYFNDYETDTYDSLKCVFDLWDQAGGGGHFMGQEMAVFRKKMENLLPWHRNIDDEKKAVVQSKSEDEGAYEELKALMKQFEEDKQLVRRYMNRLYTATRGGAFYKKRIFVEKYYVKNGQIDCLKEWMDKWMYVIDHAEAIYVEAGQTKLAVRDVVKVLLIWYQNEKREKIILGNELKNELKGEINSILEKIGKLRHLDFRVTL
ncbi:hypothetical protein [Thomasclavelia cocleata]|nr:hypothetical protein [Thomasclavelia cocleata]